MVPELAVGSSGNEAARNMALNMVLIFTAANAMDATATIVVVLAFMLRRKLETGKFHVVHSRCSARQRRAKAQGLTCVFRA